MQNFTKKIKEKFTKGSQHNVEETVNLIEKDEKIKESQNDEIITINIQPFLMPFSIVASTIILSVSLFSGLNLIAKALQKIEPGLNQVAKSVEKIQIANNNGATTATAVPTTIEIEKVKVLFKDGNLVFGNTKSGNYVVEFSDPSCPYCHIAAGKNPQLNNSSTQFKLVADGGTYVAPVVEFKKLIDEKKIAFVWLYSNGHGNGELGSKAMYCANEQGKFWEVHDKLMSAEGYTLLNDTVKNDIKKSSVLVEFLKSDVNTSKLLTCLESDKYASKLSEDQQTATSLQSGGTPHFIVNEQRFNGAYSFTDMVSSIK